MKNKNILIVVLAVLVVVLLAWNIYSTNRSNNLLKNYQIQQQYQNGQTKDGEDQPNPGDFEFEVSTGPFLNAENDDITKLKEDDNNKQFVGEGCRIVSGCNGPTICVDENTEIGGSNCVFLPEYTCYKASSSRCEKQTSGKCDWTMTPELKSCIQKERNQ